MLSDDGGVITIVGSNFGPATTAWSGDDSIQVGGAKCDDATRVNDTHVACTSSPGTGTSMPVVVTIGGQQQTGPVATIAQSAQPPAPGFTSLDVEDSNIDGALPTAVSVDATATDFGGVPLDHYVIKYVPCALNHVLAGS